MTHQYWIRPKLDPNKLLYFMLIIDDKTYPTNLNHRILTTFNGFVSGLLQILIKEN